MLPLFTRLFNSVARDLSCGSIVLCLSAQQSAFEVEALCSSLIERWESLQQTLDHPLPTRAILDNSEKQTCLIRNPKCVAK
jgi:hypothetical protein